MNDETKAVAIKLAPVVDTSEFSMLLDSDRFAQVQRIARLFASSRLVPELFQGDEANCVVALQMAFRMRIDPMMLMQNMYIIYGKPGIEGKLAIALINSRGPFQGPLQWRFSGTKHRDDWACHCFATHKATQEKCESTIDWAMVKAEGWLNKDGSKWKTMPEQMFQYRSAMFLGRLYCPEVLLGLPTLDELRDVGPERTVEGERIDSVTSRINEEIEAEQKQAPSGEAQVSAPVTEDKPLTVGVMQKPVVQKQPESSEAQVVAPELKVKRGPGRPPRAPPPEAPKIVTGAWAGSGGGPTVAWVSMQIESALSEQQIDDAEAFVDDLQCDEKTRAELHDLARVRRMETGA